MVFMNAEYERDMAAAELMGNALPDFSSVDEAPSETLAAALDAGELELNINEALVHKVYADKLLARGATHDPIYNTLIPYAGFGGVTTVNSHEELLENVDNSMETGLQDKLGESGFDIHSLVEAGKKIEIDKEGNINIVDDSNINFPLINNELDPRRIEVDLTGTIYAEITEVNSNTIRRDLTNCVLDCMNGNPSRWGIEVGHFNEKALDTVDGLHSEVFLCRSTRDAASMFHFGTLEGEIDNTLYIYNDVITQDSLASRAAFYVSRSVYESQYDD